MWHLILNYFNENIYIKPHSKVFTITDQSNLISFLNFVFQSRVEILIFVFILIF